MRVKRCSSCDQRLPLDHFGKDARATSGLQAQCRACKTRRVSELRAQKRAEAAIPHMPAAKACPSCGKTLPRGDFGRNAASTDGLQTYCRACYNARYPDTRTGRTRPGRYRKNQRWREFPEDGQQDDQLDKKV